MYSPTHSELRCEMVASGQKQDLDALFPAKDPWTHRIPGWVGPKNLYSKFREEKKTLAPSGI